MNKEFRMTLRMLRRRRRVLLSRLYHSTELDVKSLAANRDGLEYVEALIVRIETVYR